MEFLESVDENNDLTGVVLDRKTIHDKKLFHRHVSCWIMNEKGEILLQQRAFSKEKNPGKWSRTGGHVDAGEKPSDAIKREVFEEVGLKAEDCEIIEGEIFKSNDELEQYYTYNYVFITNKKENEFIIQKEEVACVKYYTIEQLEQQKEENNPNFSLSRWSINDFKYQINILRGIREKVLSYDEIFDIFDRNGNKVGIASKQKCHSENPGFYHKPVWIWILNDNGDVLLQRRAKTKKNNPNLWDMPSAGHVDAGESIIEGAIRETYEELGVQTKAEDFEFIGEYIYDEAYEIAQIYILRLNLNINEFNISLEELSEIKWYKFEEFSDILYSKDFVPFPLEYKDMIFNKIKEKINLGRLK